VGKLIRDGVALFYEDAGRGAPPLVFVHGLGSDHTCFAPQLSHFRRDHRVVAIDLRGHGQSDAPQQGYTVAGLADDLSWMAYELGLYQPVLIGYDLGGIIAVECAVRCPQLPAGIVAVDAPIVPTTESPLDATIQKGRAELPEWIVGPIQESIDAWDARAVLAMLKLPLLCVTTVLPPSDLERLRSICPQAIVGQLSGVHQVEDMIERFLAVAIPTERAAGKA
jgi:pimeloyl-ACP methyl ester carboxylesterase